MFYQRTFLTQLAPPASVLHLQSRVRPQILAGINPNPPKGSGQPEEARDERSRIEMTRAGPAPIQLGTGCGSHAEGILTGRGAGGGRE